MTMTIDEIVREFQELMTTPAGDSPVKRALIKAAASLGDKFTLAELVEAMLGRKMTDEELDRLYLLTAEAEGHAQYRDRAIEAASGSWSRFFLPMAKKRRPLGGAWPPLPSMGSTSNSQEAMVP